MNRNIFLRTLVLAVLVLALTIPGALAATINAVTTKSTSVYSASGQSVKIGSGVTVSVTACNAGWAQVKKNGITGYIKCNALRPAEGNALKNAVALAMFQYGKPYGYEAASSFNCSSLINYCYSAYGISVSSTAKTICSDNRLKYIAPGSPLRFGDILCFDCDGDRVCDHVAIYLTGNKFLNASYNAGKVTMGTLSYWYQSRMICARRP